MHKPKLHCTVPEACEACADDATEVHGTLLLAQSRHLHAGIGRVWYASPDQQREARAAALPVAIRPVALNLRESMTTCILYRTETFD